VRGCGAVEIGECTNIQDGAILHGDPVSQRFWKIMLRCRAVVHSAYMNGELDWIGAVVLGVRWELVVLSVLVQ